MVRALSRFCFFMLLSGLLIGPALAGAGRGERLGRINGQLVELHRDVIAGEPIPGYGLANGATTRMLSPDQPQELVGQKVAVDDSSNVPGLQGQAEPVSSTRQLVASGASVHKTAVVLVNFSNDASTPISTETMKSRVFTGSNSVDRFYRQQSGGAVSLGGIADSAGDVFGWWTLPMTKTTSCSDSSMMSMQALAITYGGSVGVDLNAYDHVVLYFASNPACNWAGLGELPGNWSWINGYNSTSVIAHEIGHNMGAHHAASLNCGTSTLKASGCSYTEYGDGYDVMGSSSALMSSWHRAQIDQLPSESRATVTAGGDYPLDAVNDDGADDPRLLLVPRRVGSSPVSEYFAIELRSTFGDFDTFSVVSPQVTGVTIRLVPDLSVIDTSQLLDTHPGNGAGFTDSALQPGETFVDAASGVRIRNDGTASGTASVNVLLDNVDISPPSAPSLSVSVGGGDPTLSWDAASDDVGVDHYTVERNGVAIAQTASGSRSYTDRSTAGVAHAGYRVVAVDAAANSTPSNTVGVDLPDTTAPLMAFASAERLGNGEVALAFAATDDIGVDHYAVIWVGGSTSVRDRSWVHAGAAPGAIGYLVRAVDAAGNTSAAMSVTASAFDRLQTVPAVPTVPAVLAPLPVLKPRIKLTRLAQGRFTVRVSGASRIAVASGRWQRSVNGGKLTRQLPRSIRRIKKAQLAVRATVDGKVLRKAFVVRRGKITTR